MRVAIDFCNVNELPGGPQTNVVGGDADNIK